MHKPPLDLRSPRRTKSPQRSRFHDFTDEELELMAQHIPADTPDGVGLTFEINRDLRRRRRERGEHDD